MTAPSGIRASFHSRDCVVLIFFCCRMEDYGCDLQLQRTSMKMVGRGNRNGEAHGNADPIVMEMLRGIAM